MQRRHYELIAGIIKDMGPVSYDDIKQEKRFIAEYFARRLRSPNPNFNEARFLKACGVE